MGKVANQPPRFRWPIPILVRVKGESPANGEYQGLSGL